MLLCSTAGLRKRWKSMSRNSGSQVPEEACLGEPTDDAILLQSMSPLILISRVGSFLMGVQQGGRSQTKRRRGVLHKPFFANLNQGFVRKCKSVPSYVVGSDLSTG